MDKPVESIEAGLKKARLEAKKRAKVYGTSHLLGFENKKAPLLVLQRNLPKKGDSLGDIYDGIPTLRWQGLTASPQKVPIPVDLAKSLLPQTYLNKTLVVLEGGNFSQGEEILSCAYVYDGTTAALVTYDFR